MSAFAVSSCGCCCFPASPCCFGSARPQPAPLATANRALPREEAIMRGRETFRIAILWRGDREARRTATPDSNRYRRIFEELAGLGIHAEPAVYDEDFADEVRQQLLAVDG